jgi:hypothetical protein
MSNLIKQTIMELSRIETSSESKKDIISSFESKDIIYKESDILQIQISINHVVNTKITNMYFISTETNKSSLLNVSDDDVQLIDYYKLMITTKIKNDSFKSRVLEKDYTIMSVRTTPLIHASIRMLVHADYRDYNFTDLYKFKPNLLLLQRKGCITINFGNETKLSIPYDVSHIFKSQLASTWNYHDELLVSNMSISDMLNEEYTIIDNHTVLMISPGFDSFIVAKIKKIINARTKEPLSIFFDKSLYIDELILVFEKKYIKN